MLVCRYLNFVYLSIFRLSFKLEAQNYACGSIFNIFLFL